MTIRRAPWKRIVYTVAMETMSRPIRWFHTVIQIYDKILKIRFHGALDLVFLNISTKFYVDRIMRSWVTIVWNSYVWVFCTSEIAAFKDFVTLGALFIHFTINYAKLCFISVANWINTFFKIRIMKIDPVLFPQLIFYYFC